MKANHWILMIGIFLGIVIYWRIPYRELDLSNINLWILAGVISFVGAFTIHFRFSQESFKIGLLFTLGVVISVIIRMGYDIVFLDQSSHNLAPFEMAIIALQVFPAAMIGAYISKMIKRFKRDI